MASHDGVDIGDFVLLDEITVERVVDNLKTRYVRCSMVSVVQREFGCGIRQNCVAHDDR